MKQLHRIATILLILFSANVTAQVTISPAPPVAAKGSWKPQPQFQVATTAQKPHWYALENENNEIYWKDAKLDRILICLTVGTPESAIKPLLDKYALAQVKGSMFPAVMNYYVYIIPEPSKQKMLQIIRDAQSNTNIEYAEPDVYFHSSGCIPNDPYLNPYPNVQYAPYEIHADSAWCTLIGGYSFWLGVIDDAVDNGHQDLTVYYGYDYADGDNGVYPDATPIQTHGTHVTGIAAGHIDNSIGISGIASDTVCFAKVTSYLDGSAYLNTAIVDALNGFANTPKVRVINMSFGSYTASAAIENACLNAWNAGKLLIAASGNDATTAPSYPAGFNTVMAIGSITNAYNLAPYSNYGNVQELVAPGGNGASDAYDIYSTLPGSTYGYKSGTSMAAPLVTGVAELVFDINPSLTNTQVRWILQNYRYELGPNGWDATFGYGMVCPWCAIYGAQNFNPNEVNEVWQPTQIAIYPNPSDGNIMFNLSQFEGHEVAIFVYSLVGEKVWEYSNESTPGTVKANLNSTASGIYFAKVKAGEYETTQKLVIEHP